MGGESVGFVKIATPTAVLAQKLVWVTDAPTLVRFIGICEFAGALGLILPAALKILPRLTAFAATGLLAIMVLAVPFPIYREGSQGHRRAGLAGVLAAFVAWGRFRAAPIQARE